MKQTWGLHLYVLNHCVRDGVHFFLLPSTVTADVKLLYSALDDKFSWEIEYNILN